MRSAVTKQLTFLQLYTDHEGTRCIWHLLLYMQLSRITNLMTRCSSPVSAKRGSTDRWITDCDAKEGWNRALY